MSLFPPEANLLTYVDQVTGAIHRFVEKQRLWIVGYLSALFVLGTWSATLKNPIWYDEFFTLVAARLPTIADLWYALGYLEPHPPFFYLLVRISESLFGTGEIAIRLPALIGFLVCCIFLYKIIREYFGTVLALCGVMMLSVSRISHFAWEARPYTWVIAFGGMAFYFWLKATTQPRRSLYIVLMGIALAGAGYTHFYGILLFIPIAAGELARAYSSRRMDWGIFASGMMAALSLVILLPMMVETSSQSLNFWAAPTLPRLGELFEILFLRMGKLYGVGAIASILYVGMNNKGTPRPIVSDRAPFPVHALVAAITLLLLPIIGYVIAELVTNAFRIRYFQSSAIGGILLLSSLGYTLLKSDRGLFRFGTLVLLLSLIWMFHSRQIHEIRGYFAAQSIPDVVIPAKIASGPDYPVVVLDHLLMVQTYYYASEELRTDLTYLTENPHAPTKESSLSVQKLSDYTSIRTDDYSLFLQRNRFFYLLEVPARHSEYATQIEQLTSSGISTPVFEAHGIRLSLVTVTEPN